MFVIAACVFMKGMICYSAFDPPSRFEHQIRKKNETLPKSVTVEYEKYVLGTDEVSHAFSSVKDVINEFFIFGDSVKFFPSFHNCIRIADCVFPRLSTDACIFLGFELTNHVAAYRLHGHIFGEEDAEKLRYRKIYIISFLSGYVYSIYPCLKN